jgi:predicted transcriptional regulator
MSYASKDFDDLAGAALNLDLHRLNGDAELDELLRIDASTPFYRNRINQLSPQKRKILTALVREGGPLKINQLARSARIIQHGIVSAQVGRLVKDGLVQRLPDGAYFLSDNDPDLSRYLYARFTEFSAVWRSERSEELIPDRKNPITYFMKNRNEIRGRIHQN